MKNIYTLFFLILQFISYQTYSQKEPNIDKPEKSDKSEKGDKPVKDAWDRGYMDEATGVINLEDIEKLHNKKFGKNADVGQYERKSDRKNTRNMNSNSSGSNKEMKARLEKTYIYIQNEINKLDYPSIEKEAWSIKISNDTEVDHLQKKMEELRNEKYDAVWRKNREKELYEARNKDENEVIEGINEIFENDYSKSLQQMKAKEIAMKESHENKEKRPARLRELKKEISFLNNETKRAASRAQEAKERLDFLLQKRKELYELIQN